MSFVKGHATVKTATPTISAAAYASGDVVGTPVEISGFALDVRGCALLQSLVVSDAADQKSALDLYFFDEEVTPGADNAAFTLSAAESRALIGKVSVTAADYVSSAGGNAQAVLNGLGMLMQAKERKKSIWMVVVSRGAPTYTAADNLQFKLGLLGP